MNPETGEPMPWQPLAVIVVIWVAAFLAYILEWRW